jgi:hypothetical protein
MRLLDLLSSFFNPTPPGKHANAVRVEIDGRRVGYLPLELIALRAKMAADARTSDRAA